MYLPPHKHVDMSLNECRLSNEKCLVRDYFNTGASLSLNCEFKATWPFIHGYFHFIILLWPTAYKALAPYDLFVSFHQQTPDPV